MKNNKQINIVSKIISLNLFMMLQPVYCSESNHNADQINELLKHTDVLHEQPRDEHYLPRHNTATHTYTVAVQQELLNRCGNTWGRQISRKKDTSTEEIVHTIYNQEEEHKYVVTERWVTNSVPQETVSPRSSSFTTLNPVVTATLIAIPIIGSVAYWYNRKK